MIETKEELQETLYTVYMSGAFHADGTQMAMYLEPDNHVVKYNLQKIKEMRDDPKQCINVPFTKSQLLLLLRVLETHSDEGIPDKSLPPTLLWASILETVKEVIGDAVD